MTHQPDHENTADKAAVTPPPALTTEGRLRARVQTLEEDAERNQGLAKVGARCMREGHQGLIESGRATVEGHRFALSVALDLGTGATWDAIHERVKELRRDSAEAAAVSAAVAPPTQAAELAKQVTRAIFALKSPPPSGSEHYRSGWDDGLEAAIDAARDELLRRMADETATEHRPAVSRWRVETLDNLANEWAPGTGWPVRALAVERFDAMNAQAPRWKDGTPVTRRLVRETTTYTVEAEHQPAAGARQDGTQP